MTDFVLAPCPADAQFSLCRVFDLTGKPGQKTTPQRLDLEVSKSARLPDATFAEIVLAVKGLEPKTRPSAKDMAWQAVNRDRLLTGCDRACFGSVLERLNWGQGLCFPGYGDVTAITGFSRRAVIASIKHLEARGHLVVRRRSVGAANQSNQYSFPRLVKLPSLVNSTSIPVKPSSSPTEQDNSSLVSSASPEPLNSSLDDNKAPLTPKGVKTSDASHSKKSGRATSVERLKSQLLSKGLSEEFADFFVEVFASVKTSGKLHRVTLALTIARAVPNVSADTLIWAANSIATTAAWLPSASEIVKGLTAETVHQAFAKDIALVTSQWAGARPDLAHVPGQRMPSDVQVAFREWIKQLPDSQRAVASWVEAGGLPTRHSSPVWSDDVKEKKRKSDFEGRKA